MTSTTQTSGKSEKQMTVRKPAWVRHINPSHREAIKERFEEGYTLQELYIMYRKELHDSEKIAYRQLHAITDGLERPERI